MSLPLRCSCPTGGSGRMSVLVTPTKSCLPCTTSVYLLFVFAGPR